MSLAAAPGRERPFIVALILALQCVAATGCGARPPVVRDVVSGFAPAQVRTLRSFGAAGDGQADDTAALQQALKKAAFSCLDGEGLSYRVVGTLEASTNLCLRNAKLVQSLAPFDTRPFIVGSCRETHDASAVIDCGDPRIPPSQLERLSRAVAVRTLLIRPSTGGAPIRVTLERLRIDRGVHAEGGSRTDSAGIWLEGASRVDLRDVEITGNGKGYGLLLIRSQNVTLTNLHIHDLVWAPYSGDARLLRSRVASGGGNSVPIHEFRARGQDRVPIAKFYGVRVQEQISCAYLADVDHVRIENLRIERCMARFDTQDMPWQADGLDIGQSSSDVVISGGRIDSSWEGVDVVGTGRGVTGLSIDNLTISNSFAFGLKLGYRLRGAKITRLKVDDAGLAAVVVYGPVKAVVISGARISGVGSVRGSKAALAPWPADARAAIRVDEGSTGTESAGQRPDDILIEDTVVAAGGAGPGYAYGLLNKGGTRVRTARFTPNGFTKAAVRTDR